MNQKSRSLAALAFSAVALVASSRGSLAQTPVKSGFNVFSPEQDIEVGRQSAVEAERTLPLLRDPAVTGYVDRVGRRLAANAPGPKFPYTFKVVNASDINAFALPGGPVYVTRGIVDSVRNEGELAGVMAHEISHVALRHGTNQASKAYLTKAGIGILGGILGAGGGAAGTVIQAVGGLGMNALFLKFSRTAESQADILGTQIMARSGYDPQAMVTMFQLLQTQKARQPGRVASLCTATCARRGPLRRRLPRRHVRGGGGPRSPGRGDARARSSPPRSTCRRRSPRRAGSRCHARSARRARRNVSGCPGRSRAPR